MSTRIRIVLRTPDKDTYTGAMAVKHLCRSVEGDVMKINFPANWSKLSKRDRLSFFAKKFKCGYILQFFQECKGTRKKRSLYWEYRSQVEKPKAKKIYVL